MSKTSIAIIMTVFNRIEKTSKCIDSILAENVDDRFSLSFYITNDGSTDETQEVLVQYKTRFPDVSFNVLAGNGSLFWNKGMFLAYGEALKNKVDYYLWVNNDVIFHKGFLQEIVNDAIEAKKVHTLSIICGSVSKMGSSEWSYGGTKNLSNINPYKRKIIIPNGHIQECDCVNGNCLLIPHETAVCIGNIEKRYEHGFGDFDYGYKLKSQGGKNFVASKYVGYCDRNTDLGTWKDPSVPFIERIKKKNKPNGQPYKSHKLFLKKWFPKLWLYYLWKPYVGIVLSSLKYGIHKKDIKQ